METKSSLNSKNQNFKKNKNMKKIIKKINKLDIIFAVVLILIGASFRLLPHSPNFTPICAIALFAGVYFNRKMALLVPFLAMVISDIFIGYYDFSLMIIVYSSFFVCVLLGLWLKNHKKWYLFLGGSVLGSLIFFFSTNFAVWAFTPWYTKNILGLIQCYAMALPFFKSTLLGDLFYVFLFFSAYEFVYYLVAKKKPVFSFDILKK
jgi:hypothetical protein